MTEQEKAQIEAQQACKRVTCPHCSGEIVVSDRPLCGIGQRNVFGARVASVQQRGLVPGGVVYR